MAEGEAVMLYRSLERTAERLGRDAAAYTRLVRPFLAQPHALLADAMAPLRMPDHPLLMLRFGLRAVLNTSFNPSGYPIVATPVEAMAMFARTDMDALVLNRSVIWKQR